MSYKDYEKNSPAYIENLWAEFCKMHKGEEVPGYADGSDGSVGTTDKSLPVPGKKELTPERQADYDMTLNTPENQSNEMFNQTKSEKAAAHKEDQARNPASVPGLAKGGEVKKPHDKKNLKKLKQSFDKFVKEEGQQGYADGGKVGMGDVKKAESKDPQDMDKMSPEAIKYEQEASDEYYNNIRPGSIKGKPTPDIDNYSNGGAIKGVTGGGSVMFGDTVIADHQRPALGYKNAPKFANGGQVQPKEKTHQEKIVDILHSLTSNPHISNVPNYADGSDGEVKAQVYNEDRPEVLNPSILESQYAPIEAAAQQAADDSTQGAIANLSAEQQAEQEAASAQKPDSATVVVDQPAKDVRQLSPDTITSDDADQQALGDAEQDVADRKKETEDQDIPVDQSSPDREPASDDEAQSAAEAAQPLLEKADPQTQSSILNQLLSAQNAQRSELQRQDMMKYGNLLASGLAGRGGAKVSPLPASTFQNKELANLPIQNFQQQLAVDKEDPTSAISKTYQDHILAALPNATPQQIANIRGSSASNLDKFLPQQTKLIYGQNAVAGKLKAIDEKAKQDFAAKTGQQMAPVESLPTAAPGQGTIAQGAEAKTATNIATENAKQPNRMELAKLKGSLAEQMFNLRDAQKVKGLSVDFYKVWNPMTSSRSPLGMAARTSIFADKLPVLVNTYKDLNDVPDNLVTDANISFGNLISQGVPPATLQNLLNKNNLPRDPGKIWTWITANPTGANQKEMLKVLIDAAGTQKQLADAQLKDAAMPLLKGFEFKGMPAEQRDQILKRFGSNEEQYQNWQGGGQYAKQVVQAAPTKGSGGQAQPQREIASTSSAPLAPNEVKRQTKPDEDHPQGRIAIFDKNTKQFLRYEQ